MKKMISLLASTLLLSGSLTAIGSEAGKSKTAVTTQAMNGDEQATHILNRVTFGPRPGDIERVKKMGIQAYMEEQLNPDKLPNPFGKDRPEIMAMNADPIDDVRSYRQFKKGKNANKKAKFQEAENKGAQQAANRVADKDMIAQANETADKQGDAQTEMQSDKPTDAAAPLKRKQGAKVKAAAAAGANPANVANKQVAAQYMQARLERAIDSPRQLEEVMTDFWFNHFNICIRKGLDKVLAGPYEEQAIRPHVLGNFKDLVTATSLHPGMLVYLDNWQNTAPSAAGAKGKGLNENYARELMELHTLGVEGGYSQKDVQELARILTGLTIARVANANANAAGRINPNVTRVGNFGAVFDSSKHDFTDKVLLGKTIKGSGYSEIEQAVDLLCKQPATAHHIAFQLAQYFVADNPPSALVDKLAARFTETGGNIKLVMETLLSSPEFWSPTYQQNKFKSPMRYVVSALRATGVEPARYEPVIGFLREQGEPIYGCLTPDGYKNTKDAWMNPDALMRRLNFATELGTGHLPGMKVAPPEYRALGATISNSKFSTQTVQAIAQQPEELRSSLLIGSPEFMRY